MKNKKKLLSILLGFMLLFFVGCGGNKGSASTKQTVKASKNITSESQNKSSKDDNKKQEDKLQNEDSKDNKSSESTTSENSSKDDKSKEESKSNTSATSNKNSTNAKSNNSSKTVKSNAAKSQSKKNNQNSAKTSKNSNTFTIILSREEKGYTGQKSKRITSKQVAVENNKNAMTYLKENYNAIDTGGLIIEIKGIHNIYPLREKTKEQKKLGVLGIDWFIYLNDVKTPVGANDIYPKKGDILHLDIHQWDKRELVP